MEIPVYAICGFLDSGKTNFINGILEDGFAAQDRTLLICCEEGEEEYSERFLKNVTVVTKDDPEELTTEFLKECEKKYRPKQILFEYNGMWPLEKLFRDLPKNWILYQIMTFVEAATFDVYSKNMGQIMMEKIVNADMIVFNRCTPALRDSLRSRNLRMVNRRADIYLEYENGESEDYCTGDEAPFDLSAPVLQLPDEDYGVWYVDAMDHPERYDGKDMEFTALMCHSTKYPGVHCPGRFAMVCCEDDITFMGVACKGENLEQFPNKTWVRILATIRKEYHTAYEGDGPVLYAKTVTVCDKPKEELITF